MYDYIIIGAGYAGITAASLLAKRGYATLLLEAHSTLGGCASFFRKKNFTFDVGATTLSGLLPHQPLGRVFHELDIQPNVRRLEDAMLISLVDETKKRRECVRVANKDEWIESASLLFGGQGQRQLWNKLYDIEKQVWEVTGATYRLPPRSLRDFVSLVKPSLLKHLTLFPNMMVSFESLLRRSGMASNNLFRRFVDEQLIISTQSNSDRAPITSAAMGLCYPSETYYPYGGMYAPLLLMQKSMKLHGGEVLFRHKVSRIARNGSGYRVHAADKTFDCRGIISSIPIWNMAECTQGEMRSYFHRSATKFNESWAAFTVYFAVKKVFPIRSAYYQIHVTEPIPFCSSHSVFVSFSLDDDTHKAPEGYRTVTVSTHTTSEEWENLSHEEYQRRKQIVSQAIIKQLMESIPGLSDAELLFLDGGTPQTFEHYTQRYRGYVGGIPHTIQRNLLLMPPNTTPFPNFYMIGDSVFPGQGTPAVALGALNVVNRISCSM